MIESMKVGTSDSGKETARIAEEAGIIRRVRLGDADAFRPLIERYQNRVYGIALRLVRDPHDAEDVCQETFVRAFRALDGFDTRYPFVNWLLRITTNLSRSFLKRRRRTMPLSDGGPVAAASPTPQETEENVAAVKEAIEVGLARLNHTKRTAMLLFHQSQRSYADIAEIMDLPIGTVKTAIHRARSEIRQVLADRGLL